MLEYPLEVSGLTLQYGDDHILGGIALSLEAREIVVVLGVSGSGKTSLLRTIAGLVKPDAGSIRVASIEVFRNGQDLLPVEDRRIGFVFQDYALFPSMTVADNVRFGLSSDASSERSDEVLELVGMTNFKERLPSELSGGQQQRVALARSLAPKPSLLLLDEPFANVDMSRRRILGQELRKTLGNEGVASLMVTHDPETAMGLADRLAVLVASPEGARVGQFDRPVQVYRQPASQEIAELLGPASFVRAIAEGKKATSSFFGQIQLLNEAYGEVDLLLRPEDSIFLSGLGEACVQSASFVGRGYRLTVKTPVGNIEVYSETNPEQRSGMVTIPEPVWAIPIRD
ncbi:MAG: iron ABC transporter ATP-binding protein [Rhodospirillaceae bacterium]|nr:iron ABC transporter ATP-binding protein [Rhodospirillaceae bacterium]